MISAALWIRREVASTTPKFYTLTDEDYSKFMEQSAEEIAIAKAKLAAGMIKNEQEDQKNVSEDENDENEIPIFTNLKNLQEHDETAADPLLLQQLKEEEKEDLTLLPSDRIFLVCKTKDDLSQLEVHVYEENPEHGVEYDGNTYVHHDLLLPNFPLCLAQIDFCFPGDSPSHGNYIAVGTFDPEIEIWDADLIDAVYPKMILGKNSEEAHKDAIMSLSWCHLHRGLLLSGSADGTVKLWNLQAGNCAQTFKHHRGKVQAVAWSLHYPTIAITAAYDRKLCVLDCQSGNVLAQIDLSSDVEQVRWSPHQPGWFAASEESGRVTIGCFEANCIHVIANIDAHDKAVSALDWSPHIRGLFLTGSIDKQLKLWTITNMQKENVAIENLAVRGGFDVGKIFTASFCPDSPFLVVVAGSRGTVAVWNMARGTHSINADEDETERDNEMLVEKENNSQILSNWILTQLARK